MKALSLNIALFAVIFIIHLLFWPPLYIPKKQHLWKVMLHYYIIKKTAAETHRLLVEIYVEHVSLITTCKDWFYRFRNSNYNTKNSTRSHVHSVVKNYLEGINLEVLHHSPY